MAKSRRSIEENKRISTAAITLLVIIFITGLFLLIFVLFSKAENEKKISSLNDEIEMLKLESSTLAEKQEEINLILNNVENVSAYLNIQKENYKASLPLIEEEIKNYESQEKVAYLAFVVDNTDNVEKIIETLNSNKALAIFFTNDKETADKIIDSGNLIGLYIDDEKKIEKINEEYKDIIDAYHPDLYMVSSSLQDKDFTIDSFYRVKENSTAEGKKLLNQEGYTNDIVETTAERDFLIIKINLSNSVGVISTNGIISKLKDKNYIFLPLISASSMIEK